MPARLTDTEQLKELLGVPFTPEQLACITAPPAPQVIVAGAGSGKTTVMAARVVWLVGTGQVLPEQVLGLTFTNKAAGELAERVRKALVRAGVTDPDPADPEHPPGEPQISTYHAFAGRILTDHGLRLGIEPGARLLADATRFQLAASVLRSDPGPFEALTKTVAALVEDVLALDAELSEHLVPPDGLRSYDSGLLERLESVPLTNATLRKVPETALGRTELLGLVEKYRARKRERDLLDFGDQIALAATLARDVPEVGRILRQEFPVVLLDEYQDTSVAQRVLLAGLFGASGPAGAPGTPGAPRTSRVPGAPAGAGHAVTAVGDPCQAIYGWRGASVANLDDFPRHFPNADGTPAPRFSLSENRRSGGRLLSLANTLAAPLRARHEGVEALRAAPGAEREGTVRCALLATHAEELEWLADSLAHLVRTGTQPGEIAVLCRGAADFAEIQGALVARDLPVEVVGLSGLLHLPEVADLVATCEVLQDPTANASLVRLLTGPRWRIGPRDLALLGRRARLLVQHARYQDDDPDGRLAAAVEGTDPAEVVSLADALETFLESDGYEDDLPFSTAARMRFARLAAEIRDLRRSLADPLMDVLHRVLTATGLEVELSASPHALAARRRETLGNFLDIAAGFAAVDGEATLLAFLGFLRTAAQYEKGLDSSLPGGEDTVKVLTAHKAKGLEWDVVAVPGLVVKQFPSEQPRESWLRRPRVLPHALRGDAATLPDVAEWKSKGVSDYETAMRDHQATEELRLGYVTFTRPRSLLLGSGHWWGPTQKKRRGPSAFLHALREHCEADPAHGEVEHWAAAPADDAENPLLEAAAEERAWPMPLDAQALERRRAAAEAVRTHLEDCDGDAAEDSDGDAADLAPEEARLAASWDRDLEALEGELRRSRSTERDVPLPPSLTASQLMRMAADPDAFARELARPMPRPPEPAAARRGVRFHAWVESRFEELTLPMLGPDELPGGEDGNPEPPEIVDERDLSALKEAFGRTPYAHRTPHRVEEPFQLELAGRVIRGRIDAVYREVTEDGAETYEIVDWKTGRSRTADPLQLSVYRLAWAEKAGVPLAAVSAGFLYVRSGELVRPAELLDRADLERLLSGDGGDPDGPPAPRMPGQRAGESGADVRAGGADHA
ncbi:ATP-dependent DNA helicase [Streptomyces daqingensis]|uniref:DNA 3'-5' helicase n=1 Tax=Streptomyces daqingensis TaxID=1472640 RepID=A0ABQ2MH67_9ACTN|nr:ATP-dependent DNA helicase [Streptomyces daqingensis]GGO50013.1 ATP-dependent DNA helicase [Streptomyces daqingensis]